MAYQLFVSYLMPKFDLFVNVVTLFIMFHYIFFKLYFLFVYNHLFSPSYMMTSIPILQQYFKHFCIILNIPLQH